MPPLPNTQFLPRTFSICGKNLLDQPGTNRPSLNNRGWEQATDYARGVVEPQRIPGIAWRRFPILLPTPSNGASEWLERLCSRAASPRRLGGPKEMLRAGQTLLLTPRSGRPYLSLWTRGRNSCLPSPVASSRTCMNPRGRQRTLTKYSRRRIMTFYFSPDKEVGACLSLFG